MAGIAQFETVGLRHGRAAEALSDVSFTLERGSFHLLVGASGAGKSSLIGLLALAWQPSRGIVRLFGEDVCALPRGRLPLVRRRIGMVHRDDRLLDHLSLFDNLALPLRIAGHGAGDIAERVTDLLGWVGLGARAVELPIALSPGERQRAAVARAVIGRPDLLLADEPTGNLDPEQALRVLRLLESLNRLGTTVLLATHDLGLAGRVSGAERMQLVRGRLSDPVGALRYPPARALSA